MTAPVIEIPEGGETLITSRSSRPGCWTAEGEQVTLTTTAIFTSGSGSAVERTAVDKWPP